MNLDDLTKIPVIQRIIYGTDPEEKPNDHCNWDTTWGFWEENDEHFRNRIKEEYGK